MARTSKTAAGRKAFSTNSNLDQNNGFVENGLLAPPSATAAEKAAAAKQPKSVLEKIVFAIRQQPATNSKGVSRLAITKYLKSEMSYDNVSAIKIALKKGVDKGTLEQSGHSFRVAGDPIAVTHVGNTSDDNDMAAQAGDYVTMNYEGKLDDGHVFDKDTLTFTLGAGEVIKGWDRGIPGMRVGGQRRLVVPSKLGYGKRGCAPDIPGNATLHFHVTLTNISRPAE
jgi:FKBP-type peptidyl-prolyl cis-trans isomerase